MHSTNNTATGLNSTTASTPTDSSPLPLSSSSSSALSCPRSSSPSSTSQYIVAHCQELGRYLIAAKDLDKGEIILQEFPIASGPERDSILICPGCYEAPNQDQTCEKCGWPLCSRNCPEINRHLLNECDFISGDRKKRGEHRDWKLLSDCLMILRCLGLKYKDPKKWEKLFNMESNWEHWSRSPLFQRAQETIPILREEFGILNEDRYTTQEMLTIQAILDINAYEVRMPHTNIQASYALACLAEHNCIPNTHKTISSKTLQLTLRASTDIPKGTNITTSYCDILWPTAQRQQYLQWSKFFMCKCDRCQDSSEMGTLLSALICPSCPNKTPVLPNLSTIDQLERGIMRDFNYNCSLCPLTFDASLIESLLTSAEEELQELDQDQTAEKSTEYEKWMARWTTFPAAKEPMPDNIQRQNKKVKGDNNMTPEPDQQQRTTGGGGGSNEMPDDDDNDDTTTNSRETAADGDMDIIKGSDNNTAQLSPTWNEKLLSPRLLLHSQHSVVLDACHTLFLLKPADESRSDQELQRKIQLGIHLLQSTKPIFMGISKFRGTIMSEIAMAKIALLIRQIETTALEINEDPDIKHLALDSIQTLTESIELLKYEPLDQPEGHLAQTSSQQLVQLKSYLQNLIPDLPIFSS